MRMTITVKNLDAVQRKLANLDRIDYLKAVANEGGRILQNEMQRYPPEPSGSTYRRTHILHKGWRTKVSGDSGGWLAVVGNRVKYAPYVQDANRQAEVHQGRWQTIQSVAADKREEIIKFVKRAIQQWLAR